MGFINQHREGFLIKLLTNNFASLAVYSKHRQQCCSQISSWKHSLKTSRCLPYKPRCSHFIPCNYKFLSFYLEKTIFFSLCIWAGDPLPLIRYSAMTKTFTHSCDKVLFSLFKEEFTYWLKNSITLCALFYINVIQESIITQCVVPFYLADAYCFHLRDV